ncbi:MAG: Lrp/AsnC family transcriptional regulator [Clostridia bacterium]|nr:Lrp/AsnC family transcriptional regulator [Clostridia bacterium]
MDKTDVKIINALGKNSRATLKDVAAKVNLTSPAVSERIRRLEEEGVIEGYHIDINYGKMGKSITAFVAVDVNPKLRDGFIEFTTNNRLIKEHYHIIGPYNAMLKVVAKDSEELNTLLSLIQVYGVSQTSIILGSHFKHKEAE